MGVRIDEIPISPDKVLAALDQKRKGAAGRVGPRGVPPFPFRDPIRVDPPVGWDTPWRQGLPIAGGSQRRRWTLHAGTALSDARPRRAPETAPEER